MSSKKCHETETATRRGLYTLILFSFAVVQPVFDLLSRNAEILVAHRLEPGQIVLLTAVVCFFLPGVLWVLDSIAALASGRLAGGLRALVWTLLAGAVALQALKRIAGVPGTVLALAAAVLGASLIWGVFRYDPIRWFLLCLSPSVLLFPALFLFRPPVSGLLFPAEARLAGTGTIASTTPVVLVVFDELPLSTLLDEHHGINAHRYPSFARLASRSTWYPNATTVAEGTTYAIPAILTGRYPDRVRLPLASHYPENLFTWLGSAYRLNVFESRTRLCPEELCSDPLPETSPWQRLWGTLSDLSAVYLHLTLPADLTGRSPMVTGTWRGFWAPARDSSSPASELSQHQAAGDIPRFAGLFLDSTRPTDRGVFHYLHLMLPHIPWRYLPSGREYGPASASLWPHGMGASAWKDDEWATVQGFQRHILQVLYADRLLGEVIDKLVADELYERSLVIVTADHGAAFWPGAPRRGITEKTLADVLAVPLLVKAPFQERGEVDDRNVETIDILPTIAEVLESELPWTVDGRSVLDPSEPPRPRKTVVVKTSAKLENHVYGERIEGVEATLERKLSLFGSGEDPHSLFRIGRFGGLVGRATSELKLDRPAQLRVEIRDAHRLRWVDPESRFSPAHIMGTIDPGSQPDRDLDLAIAVNGIVRAATRTYENRRGQREFTAMAAEESFRPGPNQVEVFAVTGTASSPSLAEITGKKAVTYRLDRAADGEGVRISASDGSSFDVSPKRIRGVVYNGRTVFKGWAGNVRSGQAAQWVLLFAGAEFVTAAPVGDWSPDVARKYHKKGLVKAGFNFVVPYGLIEGREAELSFYAVLNAAASPLYYRDRTRNKN